MSAQAGGQTGPSRRIVILGERRGHKETDRGRFMVEPAHSIDGWLIHVNEPDARQAAIRGLIGSAY